MLKLAITAKVGLIAVYTRDSINAAKVIAHISGLKAENWNPSTEVKAKRLYVYSLPHGYASKEAPDYRQVYATMSAQQSVLVVVNPPKIAEPMLDLGELEISTALKREAMSEALGSEELAEAILPALGGCTLKECVDYALITMQRDKSLTMKGVLKSRKSVFQPLDGLSILDTDGGFYVPPSELHDFVKSEKSFFLNSPDPRLTPRGLMLLGPPGTGKTEAAKYMAREWGVPCYRLDVGSTRSKWVGTSEAALRRALQRIDQEEPCVVLIDEVEKIFGGDLHETSRQQMAQLLWWLAEHTSRVFTLLTSNSVANLPPELYRDGRTNGSMSFDGLDLESLPEFVSALLGTYKGIKSTKAEQQKLCKSIAGDSLNDTIPHAKVTEKVKLFVKSKLAK